MSRLSLFLAARPRLATIATLIIPLVAVIVAACSKGGDQPGY